MIHSKLLIITVSAAVFTILIYIGWKELNKMKTNITTIQQSMKHLQKNVQNNNDIDLNNLSIEQLENILQNYEHKMSSISDSTDDEQSNGIEQLSEQCNEDNNVVEEDNVVEQYEISDDEEEESEEEEDMVNSQNEIKQLITEYYYKKTNSELKELLKIYNKPTKGNKMNLVNRVLEIEEYNNIELIN